MWLGLIAMSVLAILILNSAGAIVPGEEFDSTASFLLVGLIFFVIMRFLRVPTMAYFSKPVLGWRFLVALALCINLIVVQVGGEPIRNLSVGQWLSGGVIFGVLLRHGLPVAVIGSSVMFGLMHLNVYSDYWDPWQAYWHVMSAGAFGLFACALLVVTKSMWMPIFLHVFSNAGLLFSDPPTKQELESRVSIDFWQGLTHPFYPFLTFAIPALILFWIHAGTPMPQWFMRLALKLGLVDKEVSSPNRELTL
jgi:membrane protease YdiL (CAAX protease family)